MNIKERPHSPTGIGKNNYSLKNTTLFVMARRRRKWPSDASWRLRVPWMPNAASTLMVSGTLLLLCFQMITAGPEALASVDHEEDHVVELHDDHSSFGYGIDNDPQKWSQDFEHCGGRSQSPVNINTKTVHTLHRPLIKWWYYIRKPNSMVLLNNGYTVVLKASWENESEVPFNFDSGKKTHYVFHSVNFHWGANDREGSEHRLNRKAFPLEMQAVHYRRDHGSFQEAQTKPGGLRVIGVLFRISENSNPGLEYLTEALKEVRKAHSQTSMEPFAISLLLPQNIRMYFTYNGSLTSPPCFESVSWVIDREPKIVSKEQLEVFRQLMGDNGHPITRNYRPPQPLNDRKILQIVWNKDPLFS